jgi:hypothetical protein
MLLLEAIVGYHFVIRGVSLLPPATSGLPARGNLPTVEALHAKSRVLFSGRVP